MTTITPRFIKFQVLLLSVCAVAAVSCSSVPVDQPKSTDAELIQNLPAESRSKIQKLVLRDYDRRQDPEIESYLSGIALKVTAKRTASRPGSIEAGLISSRNEKSPLRVWSLPPDRILVETRLLKHMEFENEIAAVIAMAWEMTQLSGFQQRFLAEVGLNEPDLQNIYRFTEAEELKAIETSVDLLYSSRYDPRGLVSYLEKMRSLRGNKPEELERISRLQDRARRTIAYYPPLLNPIIRTQEFYKIRKRLENL